MKLTIKSLKNLFPHLSEEQIISLSSRSQVYAPSNDDLLIVPAPLFPENEVISNILPVNPESGHADSFLVRFMNARTESERELISKFISDASSRPINRDYHLTDDELFSLISPASFQTAGEVESVRHYLESVIESSKIELPRDNNASGDGVDRSSVLDPGDSGSVVDPS